MCAMVSSVKLSLRDLEQFRAWWNQRGPSETGLIYEVLRCLVWVETASIGQAEV